MISLLAQRWGDSIRAWSIGDMCIAIIIVAAVIAIMYAALKWFQVQIPEFVKTIFWIVVVAFVAIIGIRFVMSL